VCPAPAVRSGGENLRPYLSCLASGLGRLPTYLGAVVHGVDAPVRAELTGTVLTEPGPVGRAVAPVLIAHLSELAR
jgi:hypothetical protein